MNIWCNRNVSWWLWTWDWNSFLVSSMIYRSSIYNPLFISLNKSHPWQMDLQTVDTRIPFDHCLFLQLQPLSLSDDIHQLHSTPCTTCSTHARTAWSSVWCAQFVSAYVCANVCTYYGGSRCINIWLHGRNTASGPLLSHLPGDGRERAAAWCPR